MRLSDREPNEPKTMNTNLHVLEAYTALYRAWPDPALRRRLAELIVCFLDRILDARTGHLGLFFDEHWNPKSTAVSFGHDIEASWLLREASGVLGDAALQRRTGDAAVRIAQAVYDRGLSGEGALYNEADGSGGLDEDRYWWPQAEAVVGFLNAYQCSGKARFLDAALRAWHYIDRDLIDRDHGEWYACVDRDGRPDAGQDKVGPWKAPYHNTRMCLEVMARVEALTA
jgi:mannobiose 2-epimerase